MTDRGTDDTDTTAAQQPTRRWSIVGPGIVVAATGVGAGDLVATLVAGSEFGYTLLWAVILGVVVKISLAEATGRWHLATGSTIFAGWRSLGPWTTVYFVVYVVIWGFVYGATAMTSSALPLAAMFGGSIPAWGIPCGLLGLVLVWFGSYAIFEKIMTGLVGVMFVVVVGLAILVLPDVPAMLAGLLPVLPAGSGVYTLGLVGGVGGTVTMAAYGYWINAKGWRDSSWMRVMRLDNRVAYITTGIFVAAMLVVGAELLYTANIALVESDRGLLDLDEILQQRFGPVIATLFLVGFFATSFSSLLGVWQGVSLMVTDFVRTRREAVARTPEELAAAGQLSEDATRSVPYRAYLLWLTFPPMILLFQGEPFRLIIIYGVLGAAFMPFLAITLLWLLGSKRAPREWRNGWLSTALLTGAAVLFLVLCASELVDTFG